MKLNLSGTWQFMLDRDKEGIDRQFYKKTSFDDTIELPTTTAEAQKGAKGEERFAGHLTENYHFEGYAWYLKDLVIPEEEKGKRLFFSMERTRKSTVWVDGKRAGSFDSFYVEHRYELTEWLAPGRHTLVVRIDNTDYVSDGGHMTSPDTQTNWNGILGEIYLESASDVVLDKMWIYPSRKNKDAAIRLQLSHREPVSDIKVHIGCRLTKLFVKEGRDFEHFEALGTQTAQTRKEWTAHKERTEHKKWTECNEWIAQEKGLDLPYTIKTLEILPDKLCEAPDLKYETDCDKTLLTVHYPLGQSAREWDEYDPCVYALTVRILRDGVILCERTSHFGLRDFTHKELTLYCNDREIFLRGTHDGMIFPLTGYAPMDLDSWLKVYGMGKEYGLNHYRYHTCCPPKAAFLAAAYLGIYIQAELPFWGSIYDCDDENYNGEQQDFLLNEGIRALDAFGDMPSYFAMSMGNELWGSKEEINRMMGVLKSHDNRHLYTQGSNNHQFVPSVLPNDDFFSGVRFSKDRLFRGSYAMCDAPLGFVQTKQPGAYWNYDEMILPKDTTKEEASKSGTIQIQYGTGIKEVAIEGGEAVIPHVPVVSHEIGQYEFTPDFREIALYTGVLQPENLKIFRERMEKKGLLSYAEAYFRASGKLATACYKLELEAAFRSANLSGFQLLDIKDYSGQGTALVGIFNAFNKNKGAVTKEDWRQFCSDAVLLPELDSFVVKGGSHISSCIKLRYYRPKTLSDMKLKAEWHPKRQGSIRIEKQTFDLELKRIAGRGLFTLGTVLLEVPDCSDNAEYTLRFSLIGGNGDEIVNTYDMFVYEEKVSAALNNDEKICITNDKKTALEACEKGKAVLFFVREGSMPSDSTIKGEYCTDFWCYPMFRAISEEAGKPVPVGTMGLLINNAHPALNGFACQSYTTPQWYQMVSRSESMILDADSKTENINPIVRVMDNFERNHNLGLIYERQHGRGKMLVCHADLIALKEEYPEAACLYDSLAAYVKSGEFMEKP